MRHWSRYGRVSVEYVTIELRCVRSVIGVVSEQHVRLRTYLNISFESVCKNPYSPVIYTNTEGGNAVAFGPLVEQNGNQFVLLDGVHRCLAAMRCVRTGCGWRWSMLNERHRPAVAGHFQR